MTPYFFILLAAVLWGMVGVVTTEILRAGVGAMEIAFWRALLAGGLFIVHAFVLGELKLRRPRHGLFFFGFSFVGVTIFFAAYNMAIESGGISLAVILLYTAPFFVIILARIFLKEAITPRKVLATALVIFGVMLVALGGEGPGVRVTTQFVLWGLTAGLGYGSYYIIGKFLLRQYSPAAVYAFTFPLGALGLLPFVEFSSKSLEVWVLVVALAVFSTYLVNLVYFIGLRHAEASRAVLVASMELVVAATLAAAFFGERFGLWGLFGAALVVSASIIGVFAARDSVPDPAQA